MKIGEAMNPPTDSATVIRWPGPINHNVNHQHLTVNVEHKAFDMDKCSGSAKVP
jgi:hypothetical protein